MRRFDVSLIALLPLAGMVSILAMPNEAHAQYHRRHEHGARSVLGLQLMFARPQGEFADFVDNSFGLGGTAVFNVDHRGSIGLRMDASVVFYGHERFQVPWGPYNPYVWVDVTTNNIIGSFFVGPQLTVSGGPLQPYVHGGLGFSYFSTYSSVLDDWYHHHSSSTHFDDWTPALTGGAGLYLALSRTVLIDLSGQYVYNGRATYLPEGGIEEDSDGSLWYFPIESEANLLVWKVGVSFAIR